MLAKSHPKMSMYEMIRHESSCSSPASARGPAAIVC